MATCPVFVVTDNLSTLPELCAGARTLSDSVTAILFGDESIARKNAACGADALLYCPVSPEGAPEDYAGAIADTVKTAASAIVLVGNSIRGRCIAGKVAALLDTAVLSSVNEISIQDGAPTFRRMVYGGTAVRKEQFTVPYGVVTIGSGVFEAKEENADTPAASISPITGAPAPSLKRVSRNAKKESTVNLAAAKRIVDVGRGLAAQEDLDMCRQLAKALGAEVGCSRPVAENNKWMPTSCYMGITGSQVKPELIVVCGVSGQVQHIGGINKSRVIVAINKDKAAPIFKNADFGLVGDMYKIIPMLTEKLS